MNVKVHADGTASFENMTHDEGVLIYFALEAYKNDFLKSLQEFADTSKCPSGLQHEDEMFLYHELARISALQFNMMENYEPAERTIVQEWFYV